MSIELDHVFVCARPGAPEAKDFIRFGLHEAPPNEHSGQGTSCRRFNFANAMIELLWVSKPREAQSETTRRTLLWERWSAGEGSTSPFGVCVRPVNPLQSAVLPFPAWEYRPVYMPDSLVMHLAETGVEEPMWIYFGFLRRADRARWFTEHPAGIREITGLSLTSRIPVRSTASQRMIENKILSIQEGAKSLLEIEFDGKQQNRLVDFRPNLPIVFRL
jgi:Glyoxalase-like domain